MADIGEAPTCHEVSINTKTDGREVANITALAARGFSGTAKSVVFHSLATMQFHIPHIEGIFSFF
jgi:hypothetical protein